MAAVTTAFVGTAVAVLRPVAAESVTGCVGGRTVGAVNAAHSTGRAAARTVDLSLGRGSGVDEAQEGKGQRSQSAKLFAHVYLLL